MYPKKFEALMIFWQKGIRFAYKELQEFHKWSDDEIWSKVEAEMIKNSNGDLGPDDLDWIKAIVTLKKDATLSEVQRMKKRFKNQTPLQQAIKSLRFK
jgi:hypothetical protein